MNNRKNIGNITDSEFLNAAESLFNGYDCELKKNTTLNKVTDFLIAGYEFNHWKLEDKIQKFKPNQIRSKKNGKKLKRM